MRYSTSLYYPKIDVISNKLSKFILELNQANLPALGSIKDLKHVNELFLLSKFIIVISHHNIPIGFAIVMDGYSDYQSLNYKYFKNRFGNSFMYIDRVAVDKKFQNKMAGSLLYKEIYSKSSSNFLPLCCEVNTIPLNKQSLNFHKKMEFQKIDEIPFGNKKVAMFVKN